MAVEFRDVWLEAFYEEDQGHKKIPNTIEGALFRKLQILDAATEESDLRIPQETDLSIFRDVYPDGVQSG
jgi:proteic killer suppression protein